MSALGVAVLGVVGFVVGLVSYTIGFHHGYDLGFEDVTRDEQ